MTIVENYRRRLLKAFRIDNLPKRSVCAPEFHGLFEKCFGRSHPFQLIFSGIARLKYYYVLS